MSSRLLLADVAQLPRADAIEWPAGVVGVVAIVSVGRTKPPPEMAPAGEASASEVASAEVTSATAEVSATHGAATEVTAPAASEVASASPPRPTAAAATSCERVGRDGGAAQRHCNSEDRDLVQYRSHHGSCLSVR